MINFKKINSKNCTYYFFHEMINIKNFVPNMLSIDKISFEKSTDVAIYNIKYITMKSLDQVNIDCENFLYLTFNNIDVYLIEER